MNAAACASAPGFSIDPEFSALCPPQTEDEIAQLTKLVMANGIREPFVVWDEAGLLLDGHTRFGIAQRNKLIFQVVRYSFACREDAHDWIIDNQLARRNLSDLQKSYLVGKLYRSLVAKRGGKRENAGAPEPSVPNPGAEKRARQGGRCDNQMLTPSTAERPEEVCPAANGERTCDIVARQYKLTPQTVQSAAKFAEAVDVLDTVSPGRKNSILSGEEKVSRAAVKREAEAIASPPKSEPPPAENDNSGQSPKDLFYRTKVLWSRLEGRRRNDFVSVYRQLNLLERGDFWEYAFSIVDAGD